MNTGDAIINDKTQYETHRCAVCNGFGTVKYGTIRCNGCAGRGYVIIDKMTGLPVEERKEDSYGDQDL